MQKILHHFYMLTTGGSLAIVEMYISADYTTATIFKVMQMVLWHLWNYMSQKAKYTTAACIRKLVKAQVPTSKI